MKILKPYLALSHENATQYRVSFMVAVNNGLTLNTTTGPAYGSKAPVVYPPDPDKDTLVGTETLIELGFIGEEQPGFGVMSYSFLIEKSKIKGDKRVRIYIRHADENHDGTSSAHYGDPKG